MGVMRGVLAEEAEVAAVVAVSPQGTVQPLALLATRLLADDIQLVGGSPEDGVRPGRIGDYDVDVLLDPPTDKTPARPLAVLLSPWIIRNLALYTRKLWS
jgi:hypothetical protein